jgi:hypothetical protein
MAFRRRYPDQIAVMEGFLQKPQHHGRLLALVHYGCGKIFARCVVINRIAAGALVAVSAGAGPYGLDALILGLMNRPVA